MSDDKAKEELAYKEIEKHIDAAIAELNKARAIADENSLEFTFYPVRGMGGTYYGVNHQRRSSIEDETNSDTGWMPSSYEC